MSAATQVRGFELKWISFRQRIFPMCSDSACRHRRWTAPWNRTGFRLESAWYCTSECFENALATHYRRIRAPSIQRQSPGHRIPLGLVLLAKGALTNTQLRAALRAQQSGTWRRVGECLVEMGVTTEDKVTAALAQQCGCPVYPLEEITDLRWANMIPIPILESFRIMPMYYSPLSHVLLVGFCDGVDHRILYRIEQMLECKAEPCLVSCTAMGHLLEQARQQVRSDEITFERVSDPAELARITRSYVAKLNASNVRIIDCGEQVWVRLQCFAEAMNLVFCPGSAGYTDEGNLAVVSRACVRQHPLGMVGQGQVQVRQIFDQGGTKAVAGTCR